MAQQAMSIAHGGAQRQQWASVCVARAGITKTGAPAKRLPDGYLAALAEQTGKSRSELLYRSQFATMYPTEDELTNALVSFETWYQVTQSFAAKPKNGTLQGKSKPGVLVRSTSSAIE